MVQVFPKKRKDSQIAPMVPLFELLLLRAAKVKRVAPAGNAIAENARATRFKKFC